MYTIRVVPEEIVEEAIEHLKKRLVYWDELRRDGTRTRTAHASNMDKYCIGVVLDELVMLKAESVRLYDALKEAHRTIKSYNIDMIHDVVVSGVLGDEHD